MDRSPFHAHLLRRVPFNEAELARIDEAFTPHEVPRKGFLLRAGEVAQHDHYVLSGCLRTYLLDRDGREFDLAFAVEDWWAGDQQSLHTGAPSYLSIQALEPCTLLRVERRRLEQLYAEVPRMERFFRLLLARAFHAAQDRIHEEHAVSVQERLLRCRQRYPWLEQRMPQKHMASYLGITPEFLSKNRRKLLGCDP
ncbi:MAG: Crp/Fnr family transcriptional regulator [Flavobacteriales bacterium]